MIYTVTFNPAIDYIVRMDKQLDIGMTNRSVSEACFFGGKGINVSTVLKNLGIESTALGFVAGFTGEAIIKSVKEKGIIADFIMLNEGISRINVKIKSDDETEINALILHSSSIFFILYQSRRADRRRVPVRDKFGSPPKAEACVLPLIPSSEYPPADRRPKAALLSAR